LLIFKLHSEYVTFRESTVLVTAFNQQLEISVVSDVV